MALLLQDVGRTAGKVRRMVKYVELATKSDFEREHIVYGGALPPTPRFEGGLRPSRGLETTD